MSNEEDKFIFEEEQARIVGFRRQKQLEAIQKEEKEGIAKALHTSEALAEEALELGFDKQTVPILHLVPLLQVAWADGNVTNKESVAILEVAAQKGVEEGTAAYEFLELLLLKQPSDYFFERVDNLIVHLLEDSELSREEIRHQIEEVAKASRGFFGLGSKISDEEQALIEELKDMFKLDEK